jgi:hypothetical protein
VVYSWQLWATLGLIWLAVVAIWAYVGMVKQFREDDKNTWP